MGALRPNVRDRAGCVEEALAPVRASKLAEIAVFRGACQKIRELNPLVARLKRRRLRTVME